MLEIDVEKERLHPLDTSTLQGEHLKERADLQRLIEASWTDFAEELGYPELRLLGTEVVPHDSRTNRIDLLAIDADEGRPVVIELKRDRERLQLLQAARPETMR